MFYAPVKEKYFKKWEYYQTDLKMLKAVFENVVVSHNLVDFLLQLRGQNYVYCWWWHSSAHVVLISKIFRKKVISTGALHMFDYSIQRDFYSHTWLFRQANRISLFLSDLAIFISKDQLLAITSHIKVKNPQLLYSSLSPSNELNTQPVYSKGKDKITLCYHSHLTLAQIERKGLCALLPAFKKLRSKNKSVELLIFGASGDGVAFIQEFIGTNELEDCVHLFLDVSSSDKFNLFKRSDLLVNVSHMEGFGNACLEAMSVGLPVAVSRFGASPELVKEKNLIAFHIDSAEIYSVLRWYTNLSLKERSMLRKSVFEFSQKAFSFGSRVERFRSIVKEML